MKFKGRTMNARLRRYAQDGARIGIAEAMETALEYSANNPDEAHPEWARILLGRCAVGNWADESQFMADEWKLMEPAR